MKRKDAKRDLEIQIGAARYIRKRLNEMDEYLTIMRRHDQDYLKSKLYNDYVGRRAAYNDILKRLATRDWEEL